MTRLLRVGMDLDGVNFWFDRAYHRGCVAAGILPAGTPCVVSTHWDFYEQYGHTIGDFLSNCHDLADLGLLWSGPDIPGSLTMWDGILDAGHELHVKTDRSFGTHHIASEVATRMWLAGTRRRYTSLTFGASKADGFVPDIMLEDKLQNYDDLDAAGCRVYLINRLWNVQHGDTRRRVTTHDQFLRAVHAMAAEPVLAAG